jgi:hypothetical protein
MKSRLVKIAAILAALGTSSVALAAGTLLRSRSGVLHRHAVLPVVV